MARSALAPRERLVNLASATIIAAPTNKVTKPHFRMSGRGPGGYPTTGFLLGVSAPETVAVTPVAAGLSIIPWRLNPTTGIWLAGTTTTGIALGTQWVCSDLSGAHGLYFQLDAATVSVAGNVLLHFAEMF